MVQSFPMRPETEIHAEQAFLQRRLVEIERSMGVVAAVGGGATAISQPLDVLDRARELTSDTLRQVRIRSIEECVNGQISWLDRSEAKIGLADGEPKLALDRIVLDRRLLSDILKAWRAGRN